MKIQTEIPKIEQMRGEVIITIRSLNPETNLRQKEEQSRAKIMLEILDEDKKNQLLIG